MLRAPLRTLPRALPRRPAPPAQLRNVSTGSTQRRFAVYQSQTTNPVVYASLGLAALLGWTAAILTVGGNNGKRAEKLKALAGDAAHSVKDTAHSAKETIVDKAQSVKDVVVDKAESAKDAVTDKAHSAKEAAADKAASAKKAVEGKAQAAKGKAQAAKEAVTDKAQAAKDTVEDKAQSAKDAVAGAADDVASAAPGAASAADPSSQQAAFNPETGEINWDCPCLGGMADGPCGDEFKAAFSCFVYSEAEPKGIDCVDKFRGMQECFRRHPDIYGDEAEDLEASEEDEGFDLVSRAEAALALPDDHFLAQAAEEAPTRKQADAAATLE
ncbi:hypothetical protein JCM3775_004839 [Rhodotorula graminis]